MAPRRFKRRVVRRRKAAPKKRVAKLRAPMKNAINRLIHKQVENKYVTLFNTTQAASVAQQFTEAIDVNSKCYPLLPLLSQGTADYQRIGDTVRPMSLVVKFTMTCTGSPTTNSSEQLWGRLFILQDKSIKFSGSLQAIAGSQPGTPIGTLLDLGNGTLTSYQGSSTDNNWRVNKRQYHVYHDKLIKFQRGYGTLPQAANVVPYVGDQIYTSPLATHQMTLRIPCPASLKYSKDLDVWPSNFAPFFCFGYNSPSQNTAPPFEGAMDYRVVINWVSHFEYEDA